jgi:putative protein-disulfide isomerase
MQAIHPTSDADPNVELIYVGDPMCSWCWGFDSVLTRLDERYAFPMRTIVGGLRPGPSAEALDDRMRRYLLHHWELVSQRSGQPFDERQLDRDGWVYDTEMGARAVVTMRDMAPELTRRFFSRLQRAFYAEVVDITDPAAYPALLEEFAVDADVFMQRLVDESSKEAAWADFAEARRYGVSGFPTLLVQAGDELAIVCRGYAPYEGLEPALTAWLDERADITARGLVCELGEPC